MKLFQFHTVPIMLQNMDNMNFNVRLHNEYYLPYIKPSQRPREDLLMFSSYELTLIMRWGIHLIQMFAVTELEPRPPGARQKEIEEEVARERNTVIKSFGDKKPTEYCFMTTGKKKWNFHRQPQDRQHTWVGDSGASCHFTNDDTGMFNWRNINESIGVSDGRDALATKQGTLLVEVQQRNGNKSIITINDCKYVPSLKSNLFSITCSVI
jgi:hypothetical protein